MDTVIVASAPPARVNGNGNGPRSNDVTMRIRQFIVACKAAGLSARTIAFYQNALSRWVEHIGQSDYRDGEVTLAFIVDLQEKSTRYEGHPTRAQLAGGLSPYTVRGYVRTVKRFFNWMVEEEYIVESPLRRIKMPKAPKRLPKGMEQDDFEKMLAVAQDPRDRSLLLMMRDTGCRAGELCNCRVRDVNLARGLVVLFGKSNRERFAFLSPLTAEALRAYMNGRQIGGEDEPLFVSRNGAFEPKTVYKVFRRLAQAAHVRGKYNPHALRHAFARDWLIDGGDLSSLSDLLGHRDLETTKVYAALRVNELQALHRQHSPVKAPPMPATSTAAPARSAQRVSTWRPEPVAPPARLSDKLGKRELEVARLVAEGLMNKEIAARLAVSTRTIEAHVSNICHKLEIKNRTALTKLVTLDAAP